MKHLSLLFLLATLASAPASAQTQDPIRLQCDGKYYNFVAKPPILDVELKGIYVEIYSKDVKVVGAPAFDATYLITKRDEVFIGFQLPGNKRYSGSINRLSGQLSLNALSERSNTQANHAITAICRRAQPLF